MPDPKRILIVGGGFTGLAAAYRLSRQPGFSITLLERSNELGGLAAGFPLLGTWFEKVYHHLFLNDTCILQLVEELGLNDRLVWCESSIGIYIGGRSYPFMSPLDLLRFTPCGFPGRVRLGVVALYLKHKRNWRPFIAQPAHQWMSKACGRDVMDSVWTPLLKGKFDRYYDTVSMAWLWARIHARSRSRPPGGGREKLGYFRGGFSEVIRRLESELTRRSVTIQTGAVVESFSGNDRSAVVNGRRVPFDHCLFTGPSPAFARLLPKDPALEPYQRKLCSIDYLGAMCLIFASDQSIGDFYWLNVNEPGAPFLVFIHHTRLVDKNWYQNKHVYYLGTYARTDGPLYTLPDDELTGLWLGYLRKMFPQFDPARISDRHLFRFNAAQHIVDTGFEEKIPDYRTPLPGVFLANFSQIFPEDRGTSCAVREGFKVADMILEEEHK